MKGYIRKDYADGAPALNWEEKDWTVFYFRLHRERYGKRAREKFTEVLPFIRSMLGFAEDERLAVNEIVEYMNWCFSIGSGMKASLLASEKTFSMWQRKR